MKDQRYCFLQDDDGHEYLVPVEDALDFRHWVDSGESELTRDKFESYRLGGWRGRYSFTDPREDLVL